MERISHCIEQAVQDLFNQKVTIGLDRPDVKFGDYATNIALQLAKPLGKNPREVAEQLATKLRESGEFKEVSIAGPGFINMRLSDQSLKNLVNMVTSKQRANTEVVIETNCPNPFKPMHIGHAFNAIIGDTLANLLEASGATTHRVSYHGDVGTHVGRSMYSLLNYCNGNPDKLLEVPADDRNKFMGRMYAEGAAAHKQNPEASAKIEELTAQSFTQEDPVYVKVYNTVLDWSFEELDKSVARLGNVPTEKRYLESQADQRGVDTVRTNTPRVFQLSDGAYIFKGSNYGSFDNVFVTSTGRGLYAARDLGLMQLKNDDYPGSSRNYTVTAEEQRDYFVGVIAAAGLCQPELAEKAANITTGTVKLTTGKMSSRSGDVVTIDWLFDSIYEAVAEMGGSNIDDIIAGALRYQFLKSRIGGDVVFDINEAVSITGNSGPYLQYAHARACSILEKSTITAQQPDEYDGAERALLLKITEFNEVINRALAELMPHSICTYLYELSQEFNRFYESSRIIGDEREAVRVGLATLYRDTLARGLGLLGIKAPTRM